MLRLRAEGIQEFSLPALDPNDYESGPYMGPQIIQGEAQGGGVTGEAGVGDLLRINLPDLPGRATPIGSIYYNDGTGAEIDDLLQIVLWGLAAIEKAAIDLSLQVSNQGWPNPIVPSEDITDSQDQSLSPGAF